MSDHQVAEETQQSAELLSQQSSKDHACPKLDPDSLPRVLKSSSALQSVVDVPSVSRPAVGIDAAEFAVFHDLATGAITSFASSPSGLAEFNTHKEIPETSLLFLRGHASPEWLDSAGNRHEIDPELYQRHLQYEKSTYPSRSLPSSPTRVFQLVIPTICFRNVDSSPDEPENLQHDRGKVSEGMSKYFLQLRTGTKVADSVVRNCLLFSKQGYVLEQTISIEVGPPGDHWRAIVWLDSGRDLSQSVEGPWSPLPGAGSRESYFVPVTMHRRIPMFGSPPESPHRPATPTGLDQATDANSSGKPTEERKAAQNVCLLPFLYGSHLDKSVARQDALYALSDLLCFAAAAESQFLNLLDSHIEHELSFACRSNIAGRHDVSLLNLEYIRTQLEPHIIGLAETNRILENRHSLDWPRAETATEAAATAEKEAAMLLTDFRYLLEHSQALARRCEKATQTLTMCAVLEKSRRASRNAKHMQKLIMLTTFSIPLSFICSICRMSPLPFWLWPVTAGLLSFVLYRSDDLPNLFPFQANPGTGSSREETVHMDRDVWPEEERSWIYARNVGLDLRGGVFDVLL